MSYDGAGAMMYLSLVKWSNFHFVFFRKPLKEGNILGVRRIFLLLACTYDAAFWIN